MSGKRIALIFLLTGSLLMSACSTAISSKPPLHEDPLTTSDANSAKTGPGAEPAKPVEYRQKTENLPSKESLTAFPGVLESMSMTLEQIVTVLGTQFELKENKAQGCDTYSFPQYELAFDFDRVNKKISTIWLNKVPYYVYSGAFTAHDLNRDGKPEKIAAYEDQQYNGHILVMDGASPGYSQTDLNFFGSECCIEALSDFGPGKESIILAKTLGENGGNVLAWSNGKLTSILPEDTNEIAQNTMVTLEGNKAVLVNEARKILYVCPLPDRIASYIEGRTDAGTHRFSISLQPSVSGDTIELKVRTSLQVMLSSNYNFIDSTDGTFCDVAQITKAYQYLGHGKWQEQSVDGGPKYGNAAAVTISPEDLSINGLTIYDDYKALNRAGKADLSSYTEDELNEGIVLTEDGLTVGITQGLVTYLSIDGESAGSTSKGLRLTDTRDKVLSLYGLPDKGYKEDPVWTYYVISEEKTGGNQSFFMNTLNLEFDGEKLCRIWISSYVTAY